MSDKARLKIIVTLNDLTNQWRAVMDGWEPGDAIGVGDTPGEAVDDMILSIDLLNQPEA